MELIHAPSSLPTFIIITHKTTKNKHRRAMIGLSVLNIWIAIKMYAKAIEPKNMDTSLSFMFRCPLIESLIRNQSVFRPSNASCLTDNLVQFLTTTINILACTIHTD